MIRFKDFHPVLLTVYFISVAAIGAVLRHPLIQLASFSGALSYLLISGAAKPRLFVSSAVFFVILAGANPLFSHNGVTVLFFVNGGAYTLEALLFGADAAVMIISVFFRLQSFSKIMTSEKILAVTSKLSPGLSVIISSAIRSIPLFVRRSDRIRAVQTANGMFRDENLIDRIRGGLSVFSATVGSAVEQALNTADSMDSRGWGCGRRRTSYSRFRFLPADTAALISVAAAAAAITAGAAAGCCKYSFYPSLSPIRPGICGTAVIVLYFILSFLPVLTDASGRIRWRFTCGAAKKAG